MKSILQSVAHVCYNVFTGRKTLSRSQFIARIPDLGPTLEVGPFTNPDLRGPTVKYIDVLDRDGLLARAVVEKYPIADPENVPEIDYVSPTGDLSIIDEQFSAVYSAHCIEHQPDLITHLRQIERILLPNGRYYLTIPDKRYCFDALIAPSDLASIIEAYENKRSVHSLADVIRYYALTTHNSPLRHWIGWHHKQGAITPKIETALVNYRQANGSYIDVHSWRFTPATFTRLINQLRDLGYTNLTVEKVHPTAPGKLEFYAVLSL